jgi:23S rRNA-/tRNA-specific pseudouridylate synthase
MLHRWQVAKSLRASSALSQAFREHHVTKKYVAVLAGEPGSGTAAVARARPGVRWATDSHG